MDSNLIKSNILNTFQLHSDNLNLDQKTIKLNDNDIQTTIPNRRSSSNSGESDVDSGIVAIEHNLSKISSGQLPIKCDLNNYHQETNFENNQQQYVQFKQDNQFIQHYLQQQNNQFNQETNQLIVQTDQLNQINKIDYQQQNQQIYLNNTSSNELESEKLRNSCKEFLPKLISSKSIINDAIYANLNTVNSNPNLRTFNTFGTLKRIDTFNRQKPLISINSDSKLIQNSNNLNFIESNNCTYLNDNQYAVPVSINCDCFNCKQNKITKLNYLKQQQEISSISLNQQILINQLNNHQLNNQIDNQINLNGNQITERERRTNQEDIKRLLIETLRQKNLEKEELEVKEKQLQMYLQEREKFIMEKEKSTLDELNKINLNDDLDDNFNKNNLINNNLINLNKNVQYENTITILKQKSTSNLLSTNDNLQQQSSTSQLPQQTYQNLPFHQLDNNDSDIKDNNTKLNEFTKSCFISRPINERKNSIDDELITKSFNGGYCSKETRKVLEGFGNNLNKKVETRSFLQKFSFKFTKAFTKAFYTSANLTNDNENKINEVTNELDQKETKNDKSSTLNQINKNEIKQNSIDSDKLTKENSINKIKQSTFIEKIKTIEENKLANIDTIDSNNIRNKINNLKDKREETKQDKQFKKKNFQINLDEYCIIKKPELTPKKLSIDSLKDDDKKRNTTIKKRSSTNRKIINNKIVPINKSKSNQRYRTPNKNDHLKDQNEKQTNNVIAELIEINKDNSQIIELRRESKKHWGFFVARGKVKNVNGVYVSRMRDEDTKNLLSGLIEVGDQILAIDDVNTKDLSILEVNHLMTKRNTIKLHVKPYIKS